MALHPPPRGRIRPHPAGMLNLAAGLAILLVILLIALRATTSPPAIAEFAPATQQSIKDAPQEQGSSFGRGGEGGAGGVGPGGGALATGPAPMGRTPTSVPQLQCVGDPPRQIEDPQSPPCVPYWSGNNGGATARGVQPSTIAVTYMKFGDTQLWTSGQIDAIGRFFNRRMQFYGRTISFTGIAESNGVNGQQADADAVAASGAFAATHDEDSGGLQYHLELARKKVVSDFGFEANPDETLLRHFDPYLWSYTMSSNDMLSELGNWYCAELSGRVASHAGPTLASRQRKLGVVYEPFDFALDTPFDPLNQALGRCGVKPMFIDGSQNTNAGTVALDLSQAGVTSVMCFCQGLYWGDELTPAATAQGYQPEWLESSFGDDDTNQTFHFATPEPSQAAHTFGLAFEPRQILNANNPAWWAMKEGNPAIAPPAGMNDIYGVNQFYRSLLLIASGIQMAGPNLSPLTFAAGLHRAIFPNPITALHAGAVNFLAGSHAMTVDAAEWFWSQAVPSVYASQGDATYGSICYVGHGVRRGITDWRAGQPDLFFSTPCDYG